MAQMISLRAADGHAFSAYLAEPAGTPRGALVVVQEIFGVNSHIRAVADGWAAEGYRAIAPALFDRVQPGLELGYEQADVQRGLQVRGSVPNDQALQDIAAAREHVAAAGRVGVIGFCWGGLLSWLSAGQIDGFAASVVYYGGGVPGQSAVVPRCPVQAHFGEKDHAIALDTVQAFAAARPEVELHVYPAGHGFNCDQRGSYDAASAALARQRALAFLRQHLG